MGKAYHSQMLLMCVCGIPEKVLRVRWKVCLGEEDHWCMEKENMESENGRKKKRGCTSERGVRG